MDVHTPKHVAKRQTAAGRWWPVAFYLVNVLLWITTAVAAGAEHLLAIATVTAPPLALYLWRTRGRAP